MIPIALGTLIGGPIHGARAQHDEVGNAGFVRGDSTAPLTVVEFGDFGCSACAQFARETLPVLDAEFVQTGRVRWRFVPFVLGPFRHSGDAAKAALCAGEQDAFWGMHDVLYERRNEWMDPRDALPIFQAFAAEVNIDGGAFARCYSRDETGDRIKRFTQLARKLGVRATPTFFVRDQPVLGALPADAFRRVLEEALAR